MAAVARIERSITEINAIAGSIAAAVEQQGAATADIARNVTETARAAGEMTTRVTEVLGEAERDGPPCHRGARGRRLPDRRGCEQCATRSAGWCATRPAGQMRPEWLWRGARSHALSYQCIDSVKPHLSSVSGTTPAVRCHCERSEAISWRVRPSLAGDCFAALAMTCRPILAMTCRPIGVVPWKRRTSVPRWHWPDVERNGGGSASRAALSLDIRPPAPAPARDTPPAPRFPPR